MTRILAAGLLAGAATFGVWALLLLAALAIAGLAGSPSPVTELVGMGFPVAAILLGPVVAGVTGGLVARRLSGLISSIVGYALVALALSLLLWQSGFVGFVGLGLAIGIPLIVIGHIAGAAARPRRAASA